MQRFRLNCSSINFCHQVAHLADIVDTVPFLSQNFLRYGYRRLQMKAADIEQERMRILSTTLLTFSTCVAVPFEVWEDLFDIETRMQEEELSVFG